MKKLLYLTILMTSLLSCKKQTADDGIFLINHVGYETEAYKSAVLQIKSDVIPSKFEIINQQDELVFEGKFELGGAIDNWHTGNAYKALFSEFKQLGTFRIKAIVNDDFVLSEPFIISSKPQAADLMPLLIKAFQQQRCVPPYDDKDKAMTFFGDRKDTVDVSGGWYDASGEKGKYLSHLSFSNYMTPQQLPMMVWNLLEAHDVIQDSDIANQHLLHELTKEAAHGADYLIKVHDDAGYFYATVFAGWTKDPEQRQICAYEGQDGKRNERYQAAFREGGGMAIAALARSYSAALNGEFNAGRYLDAAIKGYEHLKQNNLMYCDDGKENIIDDYCALLAATELFKATRNDIYLTDARNRAGSLKARLMSDVNGKYWLRADEHGERPFFHGAEAGLPVIAMTHYLAIENDVNLQEEAKVFITNALSFELWVTKEVTNPFGYARQLIKSTNEPKARTAFFLPHHNETGYWWQGENARLASLATAMLKSKSLLNNEMQEAVANYASDQINWVLGLNPYNVCMLHGAGRNNPDYQEDGKSMNYMGGICNGITGGFDNEQDIAFRPMPYDDDPAQRWRWSEQWLQHGGWMIPAIAYTTK
ncbi:glycoside hydrolase family 9 protein [Carboxylicivirga mesophila]|uniref:Glycoside hydrolase family 9 protein n=1 Tax=Carboxylicivirga mesophila TaxID=1166478 RepID=A0ABS5K7D8_9BACT|nr:glycoside hydrolase family 9 protein [Carboxylicivirga mesophila]MBS2210874.1 glycoside hydrolase family 9 protein [Carboxylicivirga mesophila]